ncbi:hypothetical protein V1292_005129 [Bradyrhizobium sp. AZCC 1719]|uniref:hypothetical protein n=1 Tax=Bradyrhizobium sp. AZCC 1719 TaxID=3117028 RepID=UPI002FEF47A0
MSDENRNDAGQFTSAEPLVGERAAEAAAGYIPHVEEPVEKGPEDAKELGESLAELRGHNAEPEPVLGLTDPDDTEPKQAFSQAQLVDAIAEERRTHDSLVEVVNQAEIAAWADNLRAHLAPELNPEILKQQPKETQVSQPADSEPVPEGLDPEVHKALKHPQVREAIEQELLRAETVKGEYTQALQAGQQMLQATVAALAPQLDGMPLELWPQAIQSLAQVDPVRANLVADTLQKWGAIQQAQQQVQQQQAYVQHQQFEATVTAEDARLDEMFGGDKAAADAANDATITYLSEHGIPRHQMMSVFKANPVLQTAEARRTIWEAGQYRKIQQAKAAVAAAKPAPQVQRPGIAASAAERQASSVDARTARARAKIASGNGDAKDLGSLIGALRRA